MNFLTCDAHRIQRHSLSLVLSLSPSLSLSLSLSHSLSTQRQHLFSAGLKIVSIARALFSSGIETGPYFFDQTFTHLMEKKSSM